MGRTEAQDTGTTVLDGMPDGDLRVLLLGCCDAPSWADAMLARRPFGTAARLLAAAEDELRSTSEADVDTALAAHPRIGAKPTGADSRREQSAALAGDPAVLASLATGNREYEARFGHVYLVCASGRSAEELLAVLRSRLGNDPGTERRVLRGELVAITLLRLQRALDSADKGAAPDGGV
ncbi:MAG: 2-oxo-4-hydroxy-4-carboxy-5-ureidoimidazoline decarboxylase [Janthinobacterium lividum]